MAELVFYLIPGLGADGRIFERLRLNGRVRILEWLEPLAPDEPLAAYATRLAAPIPPAENCWLVGVSFGGVVALEIAVQRPGARVILVSSLADPAERTGWVQLGAWLRADAWLPVRLLRRLPLAAEWFFGVNSRSGDSSSRSGDSGRVRGTELLRALLARLTPGYTHWALGRLFRWPGTAARPVAHLLGDQDRVFPGGRQSATHLIAGGTHFMIVTHATTLSRILNELTRNT